MLFWLSFCDTNLPSGSQFLGVCLIEAENFEQAVRISAYLGINPGGEIHAWSVDNSAGQIPSRYINKLMSKTEVEEMEAFLDTVLNN